MYQNLKWCNQTHYLREQIFTQMRIMTTLLPNDLFVKIIDTETHGLLVTTLMKDDLVKLVVKVLKTRGIPLIKSALSDWKLNNSLLFF
jgi:hypothetical protein